MVSAHEYFFAEGLTAVGFYMEIRFDGPCESLRRITEVNRLYSGRLDADNICLALVELGYSFSDTHQHFIVVRLLLSTGSRHCGEHERHSARQHSVSHIHLEPSSHFVTLICQSSNLPICQWRS